MIIYLEGVDGSGKSTLKKELADRLFQLAELKEITVVPEGETMIPTRPLAPDRVDAKTLLQRLHDMANDLNTVYICDRGPLSDIIYRAFDDYKCVIPLEVFWTFWLANQHFIVTVFCDSNTSYTSMMERGDNNQYAINNHYAIRHLYQQIMPLFGPVKYDMGGDAEYRLLIKNQILARLWVGRDNYYKINGLLKLKGDYHEQ